MICDEYKLTLEHSKKQLLPGIKSKKLIEVLIFRKCKISAKSNDFQLSIYFDWKLQKIKILLKKQKHKILFFSRV